MAIDGGLMKAGVSQYGGLMRFVGNAEIDAIERKRVEDERKSFFKATQDAKKTLASMIEDVWQENKQFRNESGMDEEMMQDLRQRNGEYDPDKLAAINEQGGCDVFMGLTGVKTRAAEAWVMDVLNFDRRKPWKLSPTPLPDLPDAMVDGIVDKTLMDLAAFLQQDPARQVSPDQITKYAAKMREQIEKEVEVEAKTRAGRMEKTIQDKLADGDWDEAFDEFVSNLTTYPVAFIKGPILQRRPQLKWSESAKKVVPKVSEDIIHTWSAPSPLDIYPSRGARTVNDGRLIERIKIDRKSLRACIGLPGYDEASIRTVLKEYGNGGLRNWTTIDAERSRLEKNGSDIMATRDWMEGHEFWGSVPGQLMIDRGMRETLKGDPIDPEMEYEINAIKIGGYIVYADFNVDPLGRRPYSKCVWASLPGSFYGKSIPRLMRDLQQIVNATVRSLVNNEAHASGFQVIYNDISRLPGGEDITDVFPYKVHQFTNPFPNNQSKPLEFFQPDSNASELLEIYRAFSNLADDYTGIPAYAHGNDNVSGAGRTMGGLSMLMTNAARGIKHVLSRIDRDIFKTVVFREFVWHMLYSDDESIKGDVQIECIGAMAQVTKDLTNSRRMEFIAALNNPNDLLLTGMDGRASMLREIAKDLEFPEGNPIKDDEAAKKIEAILRGVMMQQGALPAPSAR